MDAEKRFEVFKEIMEDKIPDEGIVYLKKNGFFTAPASSKYHLAYEGGLFEHSANMVLQLLHLTFKLNLNWGRPESPYIIGMLHDLCKMDQYIYDPVLQKYCWNKDQVVTGHGDKSIKYIEDNIIKLTDEEKACIRWHMGSFDEKENWTKYTTAIHEFPNVLYTHFADMVATHIIELESQSEGKNNGNIS